MTELTIYKNNVRQRWMTGDNTERVLLEYLEWLRQQEQPYLYTVRIDENPILEKDDKYFDYFEVDKDE